MMAIVKKYGFKLQVNFDKIAIADYLKLTFEANKGHSMAYKPSERNRKLIGIMVVIIYLTIYVFLAAALGEWLVLGKGVGWEISYFAVAGIIWIFPVIKLFCWMDDLIKR